MIHVLRNTQKYTTIAQTYRKLFMLTLQKFLINGLLAGKSIHVPSTASFITLKSIKQKGDWSYMSTSFLLSLLIWTNNLFVLCSEILNRNWNDTDASVLPIYRELISRGMRVWVFRFVTFYMYYMYYAPWLISYDNSPSNIFSYWVRLWSGRIRIRISNLFGGWRNTLTTWATFRLTIL